MLHTTCISRLVAITILSTLRYCTQCTLARVYRNRLMLLTLGFQLADVPFPLDGYNKTQMLIQLSSTDDRRANSRSPVLHYCVAETREGRSRNKNKCGPGPVSRGALLWIQIFKNFENIEAFIVWACTGNYFVVLIFLHSSHEKCCHLTARLQTFGIKKSPHLIVSDVNQIIGNSSNTLRKIIKLKTLMKSCANYSCEALKKNKS